MNIFPKLFLRLSDSILKKCLWQRLYNVNSQTSRSPAWINRLMGCDCAQAIPRYYSTEPYYHSFLWQNNFLGCIEKRQKQRDAESWPDKPLISIQLCVYKVDTDQLQACLDSVAEQLYSHWQLCIVEDGSRVPAIQKILTNFKNKFPDKVKLVLREENRGITISSQEAFALTDGKYVALLDHDDYLAPEALFEVVQVITQHPETDWIYSDNDKIDLNDQRCCLHAKPAWSPELLLTYNYILHFSVIRRSLMQEAGGFREGFEGSQDHDLYLRLSELSDNIRHIPRVLYYWRQSEESVSFNPDSKGYAYEAALRALDAALKRRGEKGHAIHPEHSWLGSYQIIRQTDVAKIDVIYIDAEERAAATVQSLSKQENVKIRPATHLSSTNDCGHSLLQLIENCTAPFILLISPLIQFQNATQLSHLISNASPDGIGISTGKIINEKQVDHCGLAWQHGTIRYPLRDWEKNHDGIGAHGALPRNTTLTSPLVNVCKTSILLSLAKNLTACNSINSWFIALCLELQRHQLRICVDGGIPMLYNGTKPYQLQLSDDDRDLLNKNYPQFTHGDDPLYHHQMNYD